MRLASAPVSFGVYGLPAGHSLPGAELARVVAEQGYEGVDSGPIGLFGDDATTIALLRSEGLALCGGWIDLPFSEPDAFAGRLGGLDRALDLFEAAQAAGLGPVRPMLADSGSAERARRPGSGRPALDAAGWRAFASSLATAAGRVRERGLSPTFHHHLGTFVETPEEIERFLDSGDVGLTLDTGHLLLAGGDPLEALDRWGDRIDHVHLKDVDTATFRASVAAGRDMQQAWADGPFVRLDEGDLALDAFLDGLAARGYPGWVIVEQDVVIQGPDDLARAVADQRANRRRLERWFPAVTGR